MGRPNEKLSPEELRRIAKACRDNAKIYRERGNEYTAQICEDRADNAEKEADKIEAHNKKD